MKNHIYKLAVRWEDGVVHGIIGEGHDEAAAIADAYSVLLKRASSRGQGFTIIPPAAVYSLPSNELRSIKKDWDPEPSPPAPSPMWMYP